MYEISSRKVKSLKTWTMLKKKDLNHTNQSHFQRFKRSNMIRKTELEAFNLIIGDVNY